MSTPPYRILTDDEYDRARRAAGAAARRYGSDVGGAVLDELTVSVLAAVGVFEPAPEPEPDTCTAQYLPIDSEKFGPDVLGVWQQCGDDPGHVGTKHDSGELGWRDDTPGAVPATAGQEA